MATGSTRTLWKGAISFGLVHIPVALHAATKDAGVDFDWLDKRTMDPVGYKRVNKKTGKEIARDDIVKGVETDGGQYVVLTDDEIKAAYPRTTQTIEIECFVPLQELPFVYLDRPYYLSPVGKGDKVYALLRETLLETGRVGISRVVIQTRQHLAALIPSGPALVLNLLRWGESLRTWDDLPLPKAGREAAGVKGRELEMARQLVDEMTMHWDADRFHDTFTEEVMKLVDRKLEAGEARTVTQPEAEEKAGAPSNIVDLTELLQRSLRRAGQGGPAAAKDAEDASGAAGAAPKRAAKAGGKAARRAPAERAPVRAAASGEPKPARRARGPSKRKAA